MSLITDDPDKSPRDCARRKHHSHHGGSSRCSCGGKRRTWIAASSTAASLLSLALILWLTLRPSKPPQFSLLAATATATGNSSASSAATVVVVDAAFTVHNPNAHAAAHYDGLRARASLGGAPATLGSGGAAGAPMPPLEQPEASDVVVSALMTTSPSPAEDDVATGGGRALLRVRVEGRLRWKVAGWVSGGRGFTVDCVAAVVMQPSSSSSSSETQKAVAVGVVQGPSEAQCATHVQ